jgi:exodeoxyribonuclease VII large subunit
MRHARRELDRTGSRHDIRCVARIVARHRAHYANAARLFDTLRDTVSPDAILRRGFALVEDASGATLTSAGQVHAGDALLIRLAEGSIAATVSRGVSSEEPQERKTKRKRPRTRGRSEDQGSFL